MNNRLFPRYAQGQSACPDNAALSAPIGRPSVHRDPSHLRDFVNPPQALLDDSLASEASVYGSGERFGLLLIIGQKDDIVGRQRVCDPRRKKGYVHAAGPNGA